ncbi:MAG: winged helix-turn-helix transcriptional regulator [Chloroflexi bacterium]|nr:winged helix-turn-helix transcriptional regulator [Chloroflexota bacterium]MBV9895570.1 winged helix-turn-helix transcriptional regulator [Chloroflexota bacterium]
MPTSDARSHARPPIDAAALEVARDDVPNEEILDGVVAAFRALSDPTRARILYALLRRPLYVRDLALLIGVSESAISHQLRFLREHHLVKRDRRGNAMAYSLDDHHVAVLFREAEYHADHVRRGISDHPYP